jgi:hypothetical protein
MRTAHVDELVAELAGDGGALKLGIGTIGRRLNGGTMHGINPESFAQTQDETTSRL